MFYLYIITDTLNNKVYVGQSNNPRRRWTHHKCRAKSGKPIQYVHRVMAKYGIDNFVFEVIASCRTQKDADLTEIELIERYGSRDKNKGYNLAPGGDVAWNRGLPTEKQPMYGRHHSQESIDKISHAQKGISRRPHTEEEKDKTSKSMMGHEVSDEVKEKISSTQKGKPRWTEEQKQQMSLNRRGRKISEETKLKMSAAHKRRLKQ